MFSCGGVALISGLVRFCKIYVFLFLGLYLVRRVLWVLEFVWGFGVVFVRVGRMGLDLFGDLRLGQVIAWWVYLMWLGCRCWFCSSCSLDVR